MANKRMFNMKIVDSDAFLDMPLSAQCLYFHLNMRADDDGFIGNPKRIMRIIGSNDDDLKLLILKRFVLCFDDGVIVIKHWRMHNCIQSDRYTPTVYQDEVKMLGLKQNKSYTLDQSKSVKSVYKLETNRKQNVSPDIDIDLDIDKDIDNNTLCPEPLQTPDQKAVIYLILNDKTEYPIYSRDIEEWKSLYPSVDIMQELRNMRGWLNSNPERRKTKRGIKRFINAWLAKEQDKPKVQKTDSKTKNSFMNFEQRNTDYNALVANYSGFGGR